MTIYYALWIPSYKEEIPKIQREELDEIKLQDIPESDTIWLKGTINKESLDICLKYRINKSKWKNLLFNYIDRRTDGFIFYSLKLEDNEDKKDIVCRRLSGKMPKSIYHYFKEFFHIHSLHAAGEDSLLPVYNSEMLIDWEDNNIKESVVTPIIKAYTDKFNGFYHHGKENLQQCIASISQNKEVTKNIHTLRKLLHDGYKVKREMDYCQFLLNRYSTVIKNREQAENKLAYQNFLSYYKDLDFWYHAYVDTISFSDSKASKKWGITGGILGLISIFITLFLEYGPSEPDTTRNQLLKADSLIQIKQDSLIKQIDQLIISRKSDTLPQRIQHENKSKKN